MCSLVLIDLCLLWDELSCTWVISEILIHTVHQIYSSSNQRGSQRAAQCVTQSKWQLFFSPPWPCVHVYACRRVSILFFFYLYTVSLTEGGFVLLITSSLSGFQVQRLLLPDQLSFSVKDDDREQLQSLFPTSESGGDEKTQILNSSHPSEKQQNINININHSTTLALHTSKHLFHLLHQIKSIHFAAYIDHSYSDQMLLWFSISFQYKCC